jgi:hypothetical protein
MPVPASSNHPVEDVPPMMQQCMNIPRLRCRVFLNCGKRGGADDDKGVAFMPMLCFNGMGA